MHCLFWGVEKKHNFSDYPSQHNKRKKVKFLLVRSSSQFSKKNKVKHLECHRFRIHQGVQAKGVMVPVGIFYHFDMTETLLGFYRRAPKCWTRIENCFLFRIRRPAPSNQNIFLGNVQAVFKKSEFQPELVGFRAGEGFWSKVNVGNNVAFSMGILMNVRNKVGPYRLYIWYSQHSIYQTESLVCWLKFEVIFISLSHHMRSWHLLSQEDSLEESEGLPTWISLLTYQHWINLQHQHPPGYSPSTRTRQVTYNFHQHGYQTLDNFLWCRFGSCSC